MLLLQMHHMQPNTPCIVCVPNDGCSDLGMELTASLDVLKAPTPATSLIVWTIQCSWIAGGWCPSTMRCTGCVVAGLAPADQLSAAAAPGVYGLERVVGSSWQ